MSHETARRRAARHKRDKLRAAQLAPRVIAPERCARCNHSRIMHEHEGIGRVIASHCESYGCDCTSYEEA